MQSELKPAPAVGRFTAALPPFPDRTTKRFSAPTAAHVRLWKVSVCVLRSRSQFLKRYTAVNEGRHKKKQIGKVKGFHMGVFYFACF